MLLFLRSVLKPRVFLYSGLMCIVLSICLITPTALAQSGSSTDADPEPEHALETRDYFPLIASPPSELVYDRAKVQYCEPNAGISYVHGKVRDHFEGVNGEQVVFSFEPDGPIVARTTSGPHLNYPDWSPGFFSHILSTDGAVEGDWYFWVVDDAEARISSIAYLHTDDRAELGKCQQAYITFDNFAAENRLDFPMAGMQAHLLHEYHTNVALTALSSASVRWAKQQVEWSVFEPSQGELRYYMLDQLVDKADQDGINLLFSIVHAPGWAREEGFDAAIEGPPQDPQTLANFVGLIADRYCGRSVRAIEIWNEQNLYSEWGALPLNAEDYIALLAPSAQAVKAECSTLRVISGGLTPAATVQGIAADNLDYLASMVEAGLLEHVDAVGVHASGYNVPPTVRWAEACAAIQDTGNTFTGPCDSPHHSWSFRSTLEGHQQILESVDADGVPPLWVTEFGWAAGGAHEPGYEYADDNDYEEQADWTIEAYQMTRDWPWVEAAFLWNLDFRVVADETQKAQWGIVDHEWEPLPAFVALVSVENHIREQSLAQLRAAAADAVTAANVRRAQEAQSSPDQPIAIPEPFTLALFGSGLAGLGLLIRRSKSRS